MKTLLLLPVLIIACSRINTDSRDYYREQRKSVRHGITPMPQPMKAPTENEKLASIERGRVIYQNDCLQCHGVKGEGDGPDAAKQKYAPANLRETVNEVQHFDFYLSISQYEGKMPGWKHPYSAKDREDVANYLKTFR